MSLTSVRWDSAVVTERPRKVPATRSRKVPATRSRRASAERSGKASARARESAVARRSFGLHLVGVSVALALLALIVLLILAAFHSRLAAGQYRLAALEQEVAIERELLVDLQVEFKSFNAPAKLEILAQGALGLVTADNPVRLSISPEHISNASSAVSGQQADADSDWLSLKGLLSASLTARDQRS